MDLRYRGGISQNTRIFLLRHGEVHNPDRIVYGRMPFFALSDDGKKQVHAAAKFLKTEPLAGIYASPQQRARQTAAAVGAFHPPARVRISHLLSEVYTCYQGRPLVDADSKDGDVYSDAPPCFEQPMDIVKRMNAFVWRIRQKYQGRQVAAVTHGDPIAFLLLWINGGSLQPRNKVRLNAIGLPDGYPALASISVLTFRSQAAQERPRVHYSVPYHRTALRLVKKCVG